MKPERESELVTLVQRHEPGAAVERAWDELLKQHAGAIYRASQRARAATEDGRAEALAVARLAFVEAVLKHDPASGYRLSTLAYPAMAFAVIDAQQSSSGIGIGQGTLRRYFALMEKHDGDFQAAYEECRQGGVSMKPFTLIAVRRALYDVEDADELLGEPSQQSSARSTGVDGVRGSDHYRDRDYRYSSQPEHEEIHYELVDHLFSLVTEEQQLILRLAYGFDDPASERLRLDNGYAAGDTLYNHQIAPLLGRARKTVKKLHDAAIETIRANANTEDLP